MVRFNWKGSSLKEKAWLVAVCSWAFGLIASILLDAVGGNDVTLTNKLAVIVFCVSWVLGLAAWLLYAWQRYVAGE